VGAVAAARRQCQGGAQSGTRGRFEVKCAAVQFRLLLDEGESEAGTVALVDSVDALNDTSGEEVQAKGMYRFDQLLLEGCGNLIFTDLPIGLYGRLHAVRRLSFEDPDRRDHTPN
jgi:hypothetical protein